MFLKSNSLVILLVYLFFPFHVTAEEGSSDKTSLWKQIKDKDGIQVYKRSFPGSKFKEFKGVIEVETSLSSFASLVLDADNMASWMYKTEEVRVVEQFSENDRIAYFAFDFSPIGKRDLIVRNQIKQDKETQAVIYTMEYQPNHKALENSGRGHMDGITGFVKAEPLENGKIRITYQAHIEPGTALLKIWGVTAFTNLLLSDTPFVTLQNAREEIQKEHHQAAKYDFINDVGQQAKTINLEPDQAG